MSDNTHGPADPTGPTRVGVEQDIVRASERLEELAFHNMVAQHDSVAATDADEAYAEAVSAFATRIRRALEAECPHTGGVDADAVETVVEALIDDGGTLYQS